MQFIIDVMILFFAAFFTVYIYALIARFWLMGASQANLNKTMSDTIFLELLLPREINKSPLAMEYVLMNFTQSGGLTTWEHKAIKGNAPANFSLEIASLEGSLHFYIRLHKKFKQLVVSSLYAQYPGMEVVEVPDYTLQFPRYEHNGKEGVLMWANEYKLTAKFETGEMMKKDGEEKPYEMPADFLPIMTYVDLEFGDKKEEMKSDPLTSILESLGSIGKGQFAAFQIIIEDEAVYSKKLPPLYENKVSHKHLTLKDLAKFRINSIRTDKKSSKKKGDIVIDRYGNPVTKTETTGEGEDKKSIEKNITYGSDIDVEFSEIQIRPEHKGEIEAIGRKLSKPALVCVLRLIYVATKGNWNSQMVNNSISFLKPFSFPGYNNFGPSAFSDPYDYSWQNFSGMRSPWRAVDLFDAFIEREGIHQHIGLSDWFKSAAADAMFFSRKAYVRRTAAIFWEALSQPFDHPHASNFSVLSTEEIATLFHLPGEVAQVPGLRRIDSKKGEAPTNLPLQ